MDTPGAMLCPSCGATSVSPANFCAQCGEQLHEVPLVVSVGKQALVYFVSFFLAPFGLAFAFKYLRRPETQPRIVGTVAVLLTILGITAVLLVGTAFTNSFYGSLDTLTF